MKALPNAKLVERSWWIAGFIFLFLIGLVLSIVQQVRITSAQQGADAVAHAKDIQNEGATKFTQGQLDSIKQSDGVTRLVDKHGWRLQEYSSCSSGQQRGQTVKPTSACFNRQRRIPGFEQSRSQSEGKSNSGNTSCTEQR